MNMLYRGTLPTIAGRSWQRSPDWHEIGIGDMLGRMLEWTRALLPNRAKGLYAAMDYGLRFCSTLKSLVIVNAKNSAQSLYCGVYDRYTDQFLNEISHFVFN